MSIRTKSRVLENICDTTSTINGKEYHHFSATIGTHAGKRIRIHAPTFIECKKRVDKWYADRAASGDGVAAMSPKQVADATLAFDILSKSGVDVTLFEIAGEYIRRCGGGVVKTKLTDAYDAYYAHFTEAQAMTKKCVKARVGAFVAAFPMKNVDDITYDMASRYLAKFADMSAKTYNNHLCDLRTFFNWCMKKSNHYCNENPLADADKRKMQMKPPECASVDAVRELFSVVYNGNDRIRDVLLFRLALNYFGGVRVEETKRIPVEDVRIGDGSVIVRDAKGTQTGKMSYRTFVIGNCGTALSEWLKVIDFGKVAEFNYGETVYNRALLAAKKQCGHKFPDNAGRHSFISYHVAAFGNPQQTEGIVGTSEEMRKCNYQTLMTKADGEAYFSITPSSVASK